MPEGTDIQVHGCGEFFPLDASEQHVDPNAPDEDEEQRNRRVEVFLFPKEPGVLPPVPGAKAKKGELEYGEWRRRAVDLELATVSPGMRILYVHLLDGRGHAMAVPSDGIAYRVTRAQVQAAEKKSTDGWAEVMVSDSTIECVVLEWGATETAGRYEYQRNLMADCNATEQQQLLHARLYNLGYRYTFGADKERDDAVKAFQEDQTLPREPVGPDGTVPQAKRDRLDEIYKVTYEAYSPSPSDDDAPNQSEEVLAQVDPEPTVDGLPRDSGSAEAIV